MAGEENLIAAATVAVATEVAKEVYNDVAHPVLSASGSVLAIIPQAIERALLPVQQWVTEGQYKLQETKKLLEQKLQNTPPEQIVSPEAYVAVPALQAISYSMDNEELREMFANLLTSSMIVSKKNEVHPAFVEIIKQIAPDEARILRFVQQCNKEIPLIDIILLSNISGGGYDLIASNLSNLDNFVNIECKNTIPSMLDNLERLKIIEICKDEYITNETLYEDLKMHSYIQKIISKDYCGQKFDFKKKCLRLTEFGRSFCFICLGSYCCHPRECLTTDPAKKIKSNSYAEWEVIQQLEKV